MQGADAGRRFVKDQDPSPQPKQAQQLELLALADGQHLDIGVRVEREAKAHAQIVQGRSRLPYVTRRCSDQRRIAGVGDAAGREIDDCQGDGDK